MIQPRTLVSGGTGFVGRFIVEGLLADGHGVTVMGRSAPEEGFFTRPVRFVEGVLDASRDHRPAFERIDNFVHAAFDHLPRKYRGGEGDDPAGFRRRNLDGTIALFEAARSAGVSRAVFLSSRAVYGVQTRGVEAYSERGPTQPDTLYGEVKLAAENHLHLMIDGGWMGASLRVTGVYGAAGPGRNHKWSGLIRDYLAGKTIEPRAGTEVHGDDVAKAAALMLSIDEDRLWQDTRVLPPASSAWNVSDLFVDRRDILAVVKEATGCGHPLPPSADNATRRVMATDKLRALGWKPGGWPLLERTVKEMAARARS